MSPRLYVGALYNDNVLARELNPENDAGAVYNADVALVSTWRRHALGLEAAVDGITYDELDSDDELNYAGAVEGRIDVNEANFLFANVTAAKLTEGRDTANFNPFAVSPIDFRRSDVEAGAAHQFARTLLAVSGLWQSLDYDDVPLIFGGVQDNDNRDHDSYILAADASREYRAGYDAFVRLEAIRIEYADAVSAGRDSTGYEANVGVRADITDLIVGEAYVGYYYRDYDGFRSVDGLSFGANLAWTPTPSWRFGVDGYRNVEETNQANASSYISTVLELSASRIVRGRLLLGPTIGYRRYEFQDTDRDDEYFTAGFIGRYALNRAVSVDAAYSYIQRDTTIVGGDYDQNRFTLGVTLRR